MQRAKTKAQSKPSLKPVKGHTQMRERGSDSAWFSVESLVYYDGNQIRAFAYVRRDDDSEIPDGDYEVLEGLDERRRRWKKRSGKWQVKWRQRWGEQS